jgi:hypothetical protein
MDAQFAGGVAIGSAELAAGAANPAARPAATVTAHNRARGFMFKHSPSKKIVDDQEPSR